MRVHAYKVAEDKKGKGVAVPSQLPILKSGGKMHLPSAPLVIINFDRIAPKYQQIEGQLIILSLVCQPLLEKCQEISIKAHIC